MQWFSATMCYYGLSFASTSLSGDAFSNYLLRWDKWSECNKQTEAFYFQCVHRNSWLHFLYSCDGLLGSTTHSFILPDILRGRLHFLWSAAGHRGSLAAISAGFFRNNDSIRKSWYFCQGDFVSGWKVWSLCLILCCLPLHCRTFPNKYSQSSSWCLFSCRQVWRYLCSPSRPSQDLLVTCSSLYYGPCRHCCWRSCCSLPWDIRQQVTRVNGRGSQVCLPSHPYKY